MNILLEDYTIRIADGNKLAEESISALYSLGIYVNSMGEVFRVVGSTVTGKLSVMLRQNMDTKDRLSLYKVTAIIHDSVHVRHEMDILPGKIDCKQLAVYLKLFDSLP